MSLGKGTFVFHLLPREAGAFDFCVVGGFSLGLFLSVASAKVNRVAHGYKTRQVKTGRSVVSSK